MILELTDSQRLFAQTTASFITEQVSLSHTRQLHAAHRHFDADVWQRGAALGWTSLLVPEELGGGSMSEHGLLDATIVAELMGRSIASGPFLSVNVVAQTLAASDPLGHVDVLAGLLGGTLVATWAMDEGTGTWDCGSVSLRAVPREGGWQLDGGKAFVVDAKIADCFLVTARTPGGLTQFLIPADAKGLKVTPRISLDLVRSVADLSLQGVFAESAAVVGKVDEGEQAARQQLRTSLVLQLAETVGALDRVLEFTLEYAGQRMAFGRPISSYQVIKHRLADLRMWLEACHATTQASAVACATGSAAADELVSVAASYVADIAPTMVQDCVQIHGGIGVTWEHDLHVYLRRVTQNAQLFGGVREHRERIAELIGVGASS